MKLTREQAQFILNVFNNVSISADMNDPEIHQHIRKYQELKQALTAFVEGGGQQEPEDR